MSVAKLKPCPFCGGKAEIVYRTNYSAHKFYRTECSECDARTASYEDEPGKGEAIERWSRRAGDE